MEHIISYTESPEVQKHVKDIENKVLVMYWQDKSLSPRIEFYHEDEIILHKVAVELLHKYYDNITIAYLRNHSKFYATFDIGSIMQIIDNIVMEINIKYVQSLEKLQSHFMFICPNEVIAQLICENFSNKYKDEITCSCNNKIFEIFHFSSAGIQKLYDNINANEIRSSLDDMFKPKEDGCKLVFNAKNINQFTKNVNAILDDSKKEFEYAYKYAEELINQKAEKGCFYTYIPDTSIGNDKIFSAETLDKLSDKLERLGFKVDRYFKSDQKTCISGVIGVSWENVK